jgi:hypothetical protein
LIGDDESYTPKYGVLPILKYIPEDAIVWCPFDTEESEYVKEIGKTHKVVYSHINKGQDFFEYEPNEWDIMISNPPFKNKRQFFERALSFNKPIGLLMTCAWLNDKYSKWVFKEANRDMELLLFDKRIHFEQYGETKKKTTFSSAYFCSGLLPKQIIIEEMQYDTH